MSNLNNLHTEQDRPPISSLILGVASILTSIFSLGFVLGVIGLIYGVRNLIKIKRNQLVGKPVVWTGIFLCLMGIVLSIIFSVSFGMNFFN